MKSLLLCLFFFFLTVSGLVYAEEPSPAPTEGMKDLTSTPPDQEAYDLAMTKGVTLLNQGLFQDAKESFQAALVIAPEYPEATYFIGLVEGRLGQYKDAAQHLSAALKGGYKKAAFDLGIVLYRDRQYDEAIKAFKDAAVANPDDSAVFLYLGRSYHALQKYEEAVAPLLRAALLAGDADLESAMEARYLAGVSYFQIEAYEEAGAEFENVIASVESISASSTEEQGKIESKTDIPPPQMNTAEGIGQFASVYLKHIDEKTEEKKWTLISSIGYQYDDNVVLSSSDNLLASSISRSADSRFTLFLRGDLRFFKWAPRGSGVGYSLYQSLHRALTQFDTQSHEINFYMPYQKSWLKGNADYLFRVIKVNSENYLLGHQLRANAFFLHNAHRATNIDYKFQWSDFKDSTVFPINSERDGTRHELGIAEHLQQEKRRGSFGYSVALETAEKEDWEYIGHRLFAGVKSSLPFSLRGSLDISYLGKRYRHPNSFSSTQQKREDNVYGAEVGFRRPLFNKWDISLQYAYTRNDSTIALFDYRRDIFSMNIIGDF